MSKHKSGGATNQHISPEGKRLGVKVGNGEQVSAGSILVRQRGTLIHAGAGVDMGRDHTLFALKEGKVQFGNKGGKKIVSVEEAKN